MLCNILFCGCCYHRCSCCYFRIKSKLDAHRTIGEYIDSLFSQMKSFSNPIQFNTMQYNAMACTMHFANIQKPSNELIIVILVSVGIVYLVWFTTLLKQVFIHEICLFIIVNNTNHICMENMRSKNCYYRSGKKKHFIRLFVISINIRRDSFWTNIFLVCFWFKMINVRTAVRIVHWSLCFSFLFNIPLTTKHSSIDLIRWDFVSMLPLNEWIRFT